MKKEMRVKTRKLMSAFGLGLLLGISACAPQSPVGLTQEQQVMEAQRAARTPGAAMNGDEADAVYKNYLDNIGKPLPAHDDDRGMETR